jgi:hypothetical protein
MVRGVKINVSEFKLSLAPVLPSGFTDANSSPAEDPVQEFRLVQTRSNPAGLHGAHAVGSEAEFSLQQTVVPVPETPCRVFLAASESDPAATDSDQDFQSPVIEPVRNQQRQPRLLMVQPELGRALVNGLPAPRVAVLKEKDIVCWNDEVSFHVTIFHRPKIGDPAPEAQGRECPVCRVPIEEKSRIYTCPCGVTYHCEDDRPDGLECAALRAPSGCTCGRPIVLQEGYSFLPEVDHD